jgi:hypothetical protein
MASSDTGGSVGGEDSAEKQAAFLDLLHNELCDDGKLATGSFARTLDTQKDAGSAPPGVRQGSALAAQTTAYNERDPAPIPAQHGDPCTERDRDETGTAAAALPTRRGSNSTPTLSAPTGSLDPAWTTEAASTSTLAATISNGSSNDGRHAAAPVTATSSAALPSEPNNNSSNSSSSSRDSSQVPLAVPATPGSAASREKCVVAGDSSIVAPAAKQASSAAPEGPPMSTSTPDQQQQQQQQQQQVQQQFEMMRNTDLWDLNLQMWDCVLNAAALQQHGGQDDLQALYCQHSILDAQYIDSALQLWDTLHKPTDSDYSTATLDVPYAPHCTISLTADVVQGYRSEAQLSVHEHTERQRARLLLALQSIPQDRRTSFPRVHAPEGLLDSGAAASAAAGATAGTAAAGSTRVDAREAAQAAATTAAAAVTVQPVTSAEGRQFGQDLSGAATGEGKLWVLIRYEDMILEENRYLLKEAVSVLCMLLCSVI